jgi:aldehyde:ferredoxin oxidoreductase
MFLPYSPQQLVDLTNAVTGWDMDIPEAQKVGQRAITLSRVFNLREGFTATDDDLPRRFFKPFDKGEARTAVPLDVEEFERAKIRYYEMMGWEEETGVPSRESLEQLDVAWAAEYLPG